MNIWPFKCRHPSAALQVEREATRRRVDADFTEVTYHFSCSNCRQLVEIKHASINDGYEAFMARCTTKVTT